jgi:hypothetical protein
MSAQTASERLSLALEAATHRGDRVPCAGREEWVSEDHDDRAEAAIACRPCPVTSLCAAAADENREVWGVWAGVDRSTRSRKASA